MKKNFITGVILTLLMILTIPVSTVYAEGNTVYLKTAAVPEAASGYANKMFSAVTKGELTSLGLTSSEAKKAALADGFCAKAADENTERSNIFYFPVLCSGRITAMMTVTFNGTAYGYQLGKDNMSDALNNLTTSYEDPAEIYVSKSAFYAVTDNDVTVLSYGLSYKESTIKKETDSLKSKRKNDASQTDIIVVYGSPENGLVKKDSKLYYMKADGSYASGWQTINGSRYYFRKTGEAVTKSATIGGIRYKFSSDGICKGKYTGWSKSGDKKFYYSDGVKVKGWFWSPEVNQPNEWFYFDEKTGALVSGTVQIDGKEYEFSKDGIWMGSNSISVGTCYSRLNKKLSKKNYGGIYMNNGALVVLSVNDKNVRKVTDELKEQFAQLTVKPCKFSAEEIEKIENYIWERRDEYGIAAMSTDVMNNRIEVEMPAENSKFNEYIRSLDDSDIIYITKGDGIVIDD